MIEYFARHLAGVHSIEKSLKPFGYQVFSMDNPKLRNPVNQDKPLVTILGPTAAGKTRLAAMLAYAIGGEVISADSRQVFRAMDIGTGKDRLDYLVNGTMIPAHLVDIREPGTEFSVYDFQQEFSRSYRAIIQDGKRPILCGGTGLYLESVHRRYELREVPEDPGFRKSMEEYSDEELLEMLSRSKTLHNLTDSLDRSRMLRALEIEYGKLSAKETELPEVSNTPVFGLTYEREQLRQRITARLKQRLENGLIEEVELLLNQGLSPEKLIYYGLEYKYVTLFLVQELNYQEMFGKLNTAIHQFSKRQMTWFRRMEKHGIRIHWLSGEKGPDHNLEEILKILGD